MVTKALNSLLYIILQALSLYIAFLCSYADKLLKTIIKSFQNIQSNCISYLARTELQFVLCAVRSVSGSEQLIFHLLCSCLNPC